MMSWSRELQWATYLYLSFTKLSLPISRAQARMPSPSPLQCASRRKLKREAVHFYSVVKVHLKWRIGSSQLSFWELKRSMIIMRRRISHSSLRHNKAPSNKRGSKGRINLHFCMTLAASWNNAHMSLNKLNQGQLREPNHRSSGFQKTKSEKPPENLKCCIVRVFVDWLTM